MEILGCILTVLFGMVVFVGSVISYIGHTAFSGKSGWAYIIPVAVGCFLMYYGVHSLPFDIVRQ